MGKVESFMKIQPQVSLDTATKSNATLDTATKSNAPIDALIFLRPTTFSLTTHGLEKDSEEV